MPVLNFNVSDREKFGFIWSSINTKYTEENSWEVFPAEITDVYNDYALCYEYESKSFFRQYYTIENDNIVIGEKKKCFFLDVTESEKKALDTLRVLNGETYEKVDEVFTQIKSENENFANSITEKDAAIGELNTKIEGLNNSVQEFNTSIKETNEKLEVSNNSLNNANTELEQLKEYKHSIELSEKTEIISKYSTMLDEETVNNFTVNIENYTKENLEKEISFEVVKSNQALFTKSNNRKGSPAVPKEQPATGIEALLEKYK